MKDSRLPFADAHKTQLIFERRKMGHIHARNDIEEFLYREAELLDTWQLDKWLALFSDDALYHVPSIGLKPDASPDTSLFYIADDRFRLGERVARLAKKTAHAEHPRSRTRHIVSNVLIDTQDDAGLQVEYSPVGPHGSQFFTPFQTQRAVRIYFLTAGC